jgi:3-phenylpropionate/trans-cinnamate dioxygenase ferredoxin reductase component
MSIPRHIVLVGAGLAAQRCCQALRRRGHDGPITLVGDEGLLPYDRPPLSKEQLAGGVDLPALELRPRAWYDDQDVGLVLDDPAVGLDPAVRLLRLASGSALRYDRVLVATGARPVLVPGAGEWENAYTLRSAADAAALGERLRPGARLAIVGAGFIGQEAAATARSLGVDVTMIEAAPAPLHGILGPELGGWFAELHHQEGVRVLLGARIERFRGRGDTLEAIVLADGAEVACDALLVGAGVRPAAGWLDGSGLPADGVPVDGRGATVARAVYAAGDVCRPIDRATGMPGRSDHWEAAVA